MNESENPAAVLGDLLGTAHVHTDASTCSRYRQSGQVPQVVAVPGTAKEVAAVLRVCAAAGWAVLPWGGASSAGSGPMPSAYGIALSLARLNRIVDHDEPNLTLTAEAGATLFDLAQVLDPRNQVLAAGWPWEAHTLGGIVAANRGAPWRLKYGSLRDQLIGVRIALPDGTLPGFGGKVLKNVAGYDLTKLLIGSHGGAGVIVATTWKLFARPDREAYLFSAIKSGSLAVAAAARLLASPLLPACIFLADGAAAARVSQPLLLGDLGNRWLICVGFSGRIPAVRRQLAESTALLTDAGAEVFPPSDQLNPVATPWFMGEPPVDDPVGGVRIRVGVPPAQLTTGLAALDEVLGAQGQETLRATVVDVAGGRIHCYAAAEGLTEMYLSVMLRSLREKVAPWRGFAGIERVPVEWNAEPLGWGDLSGEGRLMKQIKNQLDPKGILSPGRMPGLPI